MTSLPFHKKIRQNLAEISDKDEHSSSIYRGDIHESLTATKKIVHSQVLNLLPDPSSIRETKLERCSWCIVRLCIKKKNRTLSKKQSLVGFCTYKPLNDGVPVICLSGIWGVIPRFVLMLAPMSIASWTCVVFCSASLWNNHREKEINDLTQD